MRSSVRHDLIEPEFTQRIISMNPFCEFIRRRRLKSVQSSGSMIYTPYIKALWRQPFASGESGRAQSSRRLTTRDKIRNQFASRDERRNKVGARARLEMLELIRSNVAMMNETRGRAIERWKRENAHGGNPRLEGSWKTKGRVTSKRGAWLGFGRDARFLRRAHQNPPNGRKR
jgi:hypothetical protein